jgi:hypothetical protein
LRGTERAESKRLTAERAMRNFHLLAFADE